METTLQILTNDQYGRPAQLAEGSVAEYGYTVWTNANSESSWESIEAYVAHVTTAFQATVMDVDRQDVDSDGTVEYGVTVRVPASTHLAWREWLDDLGYEEELPHGAVRPADWGE
jgi:hypothetical protein